MEKKSRYATKFYVVLMMLSLVSQLFVPFLQVAAVEVSTVVTEMTAKSTGENTAELNLSLNNTSSEKKSEQIKLDSDVLMSPGVLETLVSTEGKNVGTYQIKDRQIDVEINENVSARVNIPVTFSATDTAATATFTNGQLTANVDVAAKQNKISSSSTSSSEQKVTTSTSTTSSTSITSKSEVSTTATIQDDQANDISSYLPDSSKGTIIDKADIKFTDPSNNEVSAADVTADTNVSLAYNWSIPNELKNGYSVKAGDYFEFKLPANITYRAGTGDLGDYGTYEIKSDGTVRFTFNSNVDDKENIKGTFNYNQAKINVTEPGQTTIIAPTTSGDQKVDIIVNPTGGNDIAKSGTVSPAQNPQSVNWQVDINTNGKTLNNAVIKDTLPKGLKLTGTQVYLLNIDLKGNITGEGQQLTGGTDYTVSDNGTVTLIGNYSKTQQAFRIKYATDIEADAIPNEGGDVKFENNATLINNGKDYPAQATVTASYGKLLDKKYEGASASGSQKLDWTINYNAGDKKLLAGTVLTDNLSGAQEYTGIPKLVYTDGPNSGQEVKQADYEITYNSDKTQMTIKFTNGLEQAVKITYQTQVNTPINGSTTINNSAESGDKKVAVGDIEVAEQGIVKSLGDVDYNAKTVAWNVKINYGQQEMTNWSAEDSIPNGLTLVDDTSFVLKDVTTPKALVRGTDYQFITTATGFKIELSEAYKKTSDEFLLTYKTSFDTKKLIGNQWTNTIAAAWTDKNGDTHKNNGSADFIPKEEFVTDGTKSGSYNAVNKHITWTVVANYNQRELKNAKLVDTLTGDPEYVTDSAKLYEATINPDGSYKLGDQVDTNIDYAKDSRTLTANLPENSNKAYVMIFETSLEGKVIDALSYDNTAKYTNDGQDKDLTAKVSVPNSGKVAYKTGEQDPEDSAYAVWNITVNPEQSTLKDVTVVDKPSTNQVLDKSDVVAYGTKIATDGAITVDKTNVLTEGKDYSINITTDQTSGEQVMTIKFLHEISTAYSVHYRTLINSSKINDTLSNTVTVTGTGKKVVNKEVTTSHEVVNNSGTAEGTNLDYQLTKVDKDTDKVLSGVKFELWSYKNNAKGQLLRTGTTDDKGQIRWNNLKSGKYVLVETAPTDYQTVTDQIITLKAADANSDKLVTSTITNEKVKTSVSGEKTWVDNNDQDGVRPDEITVNLLADGKKVDSKTVTAKDGWKYKFNNLDKFKAGQEIKYTVDEAAVDGYKTTYDGFNITNKRIPEKTKVTVNKVWDDANNQDGIRPLFITAILKANGIEIDRLVITAGPDGSWKGEFTNLDVYRNGVKVDYTVDEEVVPADYTKTITGDTASGFTIKNSHKPVEKKVTFSKVDLDGVEIAGAQIKIYKGTTATGTPVAEWTSVQDQSHELSLPVGTYVFHEEAAPNGYLAVTDITFQVNYDGTVTVLDAQSNSAVYKGGKLVITDQYDETPKKITFSKVNLGGDEVEGAEIEIYAGDTVTGTPVEKWTSGTTPKELNLAPGTYVFHEEAAPNGLLKVTDITFKVDYQGNVTVTNIGQKDAKGEDNIVVTDGSKITITDKTDDLPRKITFSKVNLGGDEVDGAEVEIYAGDTVTGTPVEKWTSGTTPKVLNLAPGTYVFHEEAAPNGLLKVTDITFKVNYDGTVTVTNIGEKDTKGEDNKVVTDGSKITITDKTDDLPRKITFSKVNLGGEEIASAEIEIYAGDKAEETPIEKWTSEAGKSKIIDLKPGIYVFHEEAAPNGYVAVTDITFQVNYDGTVTVLDAQSNSAVYKDGKLVITDQYDETTIDILVTKKWDDQDNKAGKRPEKITVRLLADGKEVATQDLTAKNDWKHTFTKLPKYKNGKEIVYTITEDKVDGYQTDISGSVAKGFVIQNTYTPPVTPPSTSVPKAKVNKNTLPRTGDSQSLLLSGIGFVILIVGLGVYSWKKRFQDWENELNSPKFRKKQALCQLQWVDEKLTSREDERKRPITKYIEKGSKVLSTLEPFSIYTLS